MNMYYAIGLLVVALGFGVVGKAATKKERDLRRHEKRKRVRENKKPCS